MSATYSVGEFAAAFGSAFNDAQAFLDGLANQNAQWDVTQAPAVWSQTASVLGLLATSAQALVTVGTPLAQQVGLAGLSTNILALGANIAQLTTALQNSNQIEAITAGLGVLAGIGGTAAAFNTILMSAGWAAPLFPWAIPLVTIATAAQLVWQNRESFVWAGNQLLNALHDAAQSPTFIGDLSRATMNILVNIGVTSALNWVPARRDPLVLDLDGGGITTSGINPNAPILFDQDGDGTLTATGWIAAGEAIVVRDLNGNGTIDSGRDRRSPFGVPNLAFQGAPPLCGPHPGWTSGFRSAKCSHIDTVISICVSYLYDGNGVKR